MEEIFYTMIFFVAVILVLALAYKVDERLGKIQLHLLFLDFLELLFFQFFLLVII